MNQKRFPPPKPENLPTAIPAALIGAADTLGRLNDRGAGWSRRVTDFLDRLTGAPKPRPRPSDGLFRPPTPPQVPPQVPRAQQVAPMAAATAATPTLDPNPVDRALNPREPMVNLPRVDPPPAHASPPPPPSPPPPRQSTPSTPPPAPKPPPATEWEIDELAHDIGETGRRQSERLARLLLRTMILLFVAFLAWAWWFKIEEVTRGEGKVVSSRQTQIVANLEGGIVAQVPVQEGQRVTQGQVLMRLSNAQALAQFGDNRAKYLSFAAQVARLEAELAGRPASFPPELMREAPEVVRAETTLMAARASQLDSQIAILQEQRRQRLQELADLRNKATMLDRQLKLVEEQLRITEPLAAEGLAPRVDVIRAQRDLAQTQTDLGSARTQIPRAEAALQEAERKIEERRATFKADTQKELNERRTQLESAQELQASDRDRVRRTEIAAPLDGIVKQIHVKTIGGVVKPGQDLIELVPVEDTLIVEVKIKPADIGFVHVGQRAAVKITAYDYSIYGQLEAHVEDVSADSIVDERDRLPEPYFRVRLRTATSYLGTPEHKLPIQPGMVASADIQTGQRSVLTYLTKPIFKTLTSALGER